MCSKPIRYVSILLMFFVFLGCKTYQSAMPLNEALKTDQRGLFKVTLTNGDEFIYEKIVNENDTIFGIVTKNGIVQKTELNETDVKKVEVHNKKSSAILNILGLSIGVGAAVLGVLMFQ